VDYCIQVEILLRRLLLGQVFVMVLNEKNVIENYPGYKLFCAYSILIHPIFTVFSCKKGEIGREKAI
jgi:hypothetical protein